MEKLPSNRRKAIDELERGRNFANQLRRVINGVRDGSSAISAGTPSVQDLLQKVQTSFFNSLLLLSNQASESHLEVSPVQPNDSSCWINPAKSEDSQESCKSSTIKDRRGSYKRRRTSETREIESETPTEDGYQWRKYGQKVILNAQYPRNYYRCTHKFDQGCQATKQVQKVREQPSLYKITYYGHHICRNLDMNPEIILDSGCASDSSMFLSFDNSLPTPTKQDCPFLSSFPSTSSVKKECKEEIPSSSSNDYLLSSELTFDNNSSRHVTLSSTLEPDHKDVNSGDLYDFAELEDFDPFVEL